MSVVKEQVNRINKKVNKEQITMAAHAKMAAADVLSPTMTTVEPLLLARNHVITSHVDMCVECDARVYAMEKIVAGSATYHKWCFRCAHCNHVLNFNNYAMTSSCIPYCKAHYAAIFKRKGNYEEFAVKRLENGLTSLACDEGRAKQTSTPPGQGDHDVNDNTVAMKWIQSTSLQPLKPVNRPSDDVTVTSPSSPSPLSSPSPSSSALPAVNVRQMRAIFESFSRCSD